MLTEYKANEIRADGRWRGKLVRVLGTVGQIGKGLGGEPFVTIGTGARFEIPSAQCLLADPADPDAVALSAGGKATVQGRVDRLMGNVMIKGCVVNPMMHFCRRMKEATNAVRCHADADDSTGFTIVFEEMPGDAHGKMAAAGSVGCAGAIGNRSAGDEYDRLTAFARKDHPERYAAINSRRTFCFGDFWERSGSKIVPLGGARWDRVQAFFDTL